MTTEKIEKIKNISDKLSNFLFDRIDEYTKTNQISNHEVIASLMLMMFAIIGTLKETKEIKLEIIDRQFSAMRHALSETEDIRKQ